MSIHSGVSRSGCHAGPSGYRRVTVARPRPTVLIGPVQRAKRRPNSTQMRSWPAISIGGSPEERGVGVIDRGGCLREVEVLPVLGWFAVDRGLLQPRRKLTPDRGEVEVACVSAR